MYLVLGQLALLVVPLLSSPQPRDSGPMLDGMFYFCQETVETETDQLYCTLKIVGTAESLFVHCTGDIYKFVSC
jgi:hypothetical protein